MYPFCTYGKALKENICNCFNTFCLDKKIFFYVQLNKLKDLTSTQTITVTVDNPTKVFNVIYTSWSSFFSIGQVFSFDIRRVKTMQNELSFALHT